MELQTYVDAVREQLVVAAANSGDESRQAAERMTATIDAALRLALLESLSAAADEITVELAPGSVEVRLRGGDPEFAVTLPSDTPTALQAPTPAPEASAPSVPEGDDGSVARITLRLPEALKQRIEEAAGRENLSVNTWLIRSLTAATDVNRSPVAPSQVSGQSFTGWVH